MLGLNTDPTNSVAPRILHWIQLMQIQESSLAQVQLPCVAEGWPLPSYRYIQYYGICILILIFYLQNRWIKSTDDNQSHNLTTVDSNGVLRMSASAETAGRYVCIAWNSLGETRAESEVRVHRHISVRLRPRRLISEKGRKVRLNCSVIGRPLDRIQWLKNGLPVDQLEERMRILLLGEQSVLEIDRLHEQDTGMYQCVAENELGDCAQEAIHLTLAGKSNDLGVIHNDKTISYKSTLIQQSILKYIACHYDY